MSHVAHMNASCHTYVWDKVRELEEVKDKSRELASKFQLIGSLKKEFELAERQRGVAEERMSEQVYICMRIYE